MGKEGEEKRREEGRARLKLNLSRYVVAERGVLGLGF